MERNEEEMRAQVRKELMNAISKAGMKNTYRYMEVQTQTCDNDTFFRSNTKFLMDFKDYPESH